ncbi:MAG: ABC transporter ATP-binding protein [Ruminococcus albus]|jgi:putative ABC transport system ATP-binding protein|uniref:Peptide ABC transporter ATP-binding protein n=1 Tax=Ruminococcus albus SY3 TaxID=1341156 RepID=A0A011VX37_RUMAL|nr:ABC transporter ATP-binding protein [Ruminococcus albus]EXM38297.1 peptide ABC transporter ATP-binding protein [Ruminococcus albus SY3]EXM39831.1 peptide ABC transporter ATP-binding protein [Ruminococcus albus SY3]MBE6868911.1 ABC transporter ATP-binding protein [Ruminococcus albus]
MSFLKVESICKTYGDGENAVKAVDNVSFTIPKGQMAAIIGASGSGKSSLLHILGGVDRPTSGKVIIDGTDVYSQNNKELAVFRRRRVGLIYQFYNLIPVLTAAENITLPTVMDGKKPDPAKVEEMLELMDLKDRSGHLPSQLSGGQQQRVSIGRALFTAPDVILADEPTGNLDSKNSAEIIRLLRESNIKLGQTMIIITHDEGIAQQCDRIITMSDGKIVKDELTKSGR